MNHKWTTGDDKLLQKLYTEGFTFKEIGEEMGLRINQVANRVYYHKSINPDLTRGKVTRHAFSPSEKDIIIYALYRLGNDVKPEVLEVKENLLDKLEGAV